MPGDAVRCEKDHETEDRWDCYWRCVVTDCDGTLRPQIIKDPARFPWHEVTDVAHYCLSVDALTQPRHVREHPPLYGEPR